MYSTRHIRTLIIHCAATPNGRWNTVLDIDRWHQQAGYRRAPKTDEARRFNPGLLHVGYHWVIYPNGGLASGRHASEVGAHARGFNTNSLSICLLGSDTFTRLQWDQLAQQVQYLCKRYNIPLQHANVDNDWRGVCGHRDTGANKLCPGFAVADWLAGGMAPQAGHILEQA